MSCFHGTSEGRGKAFTMRWWVVLCTLALGSILAAGPARATLIGDFIDFERVNGPPIPGESIFYDAVQEEVIDGPEWTGFNGDQVDVADASITLRNVGNALFFFQWTFASGLAPARWIWSDLDWVGQEGEIVGVSASWTPNLVSNPENFTLVHDAHSVTLEATHGAVTIFPGGSFTIDLEVEHTQAAEPSTLFLFGIGIVAAALRRHSN